MRNLFKLKTKSRQKQKHKTLVKTGTAIKSVKFEFRCAYQSNSCLFERFFSFHFNCTLSDCTQL